MEDREVANETRQAPPLAEVNEEVARMEAEGAPAPRAKDDDEGDALEAPADTGQSD